MLICKATYSIHSEIYEVLGNENHGLDVTSAMFYQSSHENSGEQLTFALISNTHGV